MGRNVDSYDTQPYQMPFRIGVRRAYCRRLYCSSVGTHANDRGRPQKRPWALTHLASTACYTGSRGLPWDITRATTASHGMPRKLLRPLTGYYADSPSGFCAGSDGISSRGLPRGSLPGLPRVLPRGVPSGVPPNHMNPNPTLPRGSPRGCHTART